MSYNNVDTRESGSLVMHDVMTRRKLFIYDRVKYLINVGAKPWDMDIEDIYQWLIIKHEEMACKAINQHYWYNVGISDDVLTNGALEVLDNVSKKYPLPLDWDNSSIAGFTLLHLYDNMNPDERTMALRIVKHINNAQLDALVEYYDYELFHYGLDYADPNADVWDECLKIIEVVLYHKCCNLRDGTFYYDRDITIDEVLMNVDIMLVSRYVYWVGILRRLANIPEVS